MHQDVTQILNAASRGDPQAAAELLPLVYEELRQLAAARLSREAAGQTLQATALVHEAYLRLTGGVHERWDGRAHFFGAAAEAMRRILIENARRRRRVKHGGLLRRIIHRDLKPSNVRVARYDGKPVPKVIDFGVAKAMGQQLTERTLFTGFGGIVGTLEYMSPEQAEFNALDVDTRSDIYSLGVLLYELLTGSTPLTKQRLTQAAIVEVLRLIREEEPPRPSTRLTESRSGLASLSAQRKLDPGRLAKEIAGELDWIVMKALEKDRTRRYETANGLARDIDHYLRGDTVEACPPTAGYRLRKLARKHGKALTTAACFAAVFVISFAFVSWQAYRAAMAEQRAVIESQIARQRLHQVNEQKQKALAEKRRAEAAEATAIAERDKVVAEQQRAGEAEQRATAEAAITQIVTGALPKQLASGQNAELEPYLVRLAEGLRKARGLDDADVLLAMASWRNAGWPRANSRRPSRCSPICVKVCAERRETAIRRHSKRRSNWERPPICWGSTPMRNRC